MLRFILFLLAILPLCGYAADYDTLYAARPFTQQRIHFDPQRYPDGVQREGDALVLANGRIWLKKIAVSASRRACRATVRLQLTSAGDPWDKCGSVFLLPAHRGVSMLDVAAGTGKYPAVDSLRYEHFRGMVATDGFVPPVELLRFMTPFGVGAYTPKDSLRRTHITPHYIDGFVPHVVWEADVTDRLSWLTADSVYIGVTIDTWTKAGYEVDLQLLVEQSTLKADKAKATEVRSLVNTYLYVGQSHCDLFSRQPLIVPLTLTQTAKNARLYYIVSGHGGHSGGDEFRPCENVLRWNDREVLRFTPWRTDCASFRRFNPSTGVWLKEREVTYITAEGKRGRKVIEEPIASSDLSRSNWCPGSDVPPEMVALGTLSAGTHRLSIAIPQSQPKEGNRLNHWLVSAWLVWEK